MHPAQALLDAQVPPLRLGHEVRLRHELGEVLGEHHVAVLELVVSVLVAVVDVLLRHGKIVEIVELNPVLASLLLEYIQSV